MPTDRLGGRVLTGCSPVFMAWLEPSVAAQLLDGNPDICITGVFAEPCPTAMARSRWTDAGPCNSGCPHSEWFVAGVVVLDVDHPRTVPPGRPDWRLAWFPCADGESIDNWYAAGLKGTGSHSDPVAREARMLDFAHVSSGSGP